MKSLITLIMAVLFAINAFSLEVIKLNPSVEWLDYKNKNKASVGIGVAVVSYTLEDGCFIEQSNDLQSWKRTVPLFAKIVDGKIIGTFALLEDGDRLQFFRISEKGKK